MPRAARIVQVPMEEELLADLDRLTKAVRSSRSAIIRVACREYLQRMREHKLDDLVRKGYERLPDEPAVAEALTSVAAEAFPEEAW